MSIGYYRVKILAKKIHFYLPLLLGIAASTHLRPADLAQAASPPQGTPFSALSLPANAPAWMRSAWHAMMNAPLPSVIGPTPGMPASVPATTSDADPSGNVGTYQPNGPTSTAGNAFFQQLGTNGRACVTCHLPPNGMGLAVSRAVQQFKTYGPSDPLFAPVDAATCPKNVAAANTGPSPVGAASGGSANADVLPYYLILTKGLFRIALPVPKSADYTLSVVNDPYGCNTDTTYNQVTDPTSGVVSQMVSVYRRPLMAANLKFKTVTAADTGLFSSAGLTIDPFTNMPESGNIMWDGREPTLQSQAVDATLGHAQAMSAPTAAQVAQIVSFERGIYAAQIYDTQALSLTAAPVTGGPVTIANTAPGSAAPGSGTAFALYGSPLSATDTQTDVKRASIYRGQTIFNTRSFTVNNVAGLNDNPAIGNPAAMTCSGCHRQTNAGTDEAPNAAFDLGVSGSSTAFGGPAPAKDLPVFQIICKAGSSTSFHNSTVVTNDPGVALISGKCADAGKIVPPDLRALAARAPYFHDGSAAGLMDVVNFYNTRFRIAFSAQDKQDLVNFLNAL